MQDTNQGVDCAGCALKNVEGTDCAGFISKTTIKSVTSGFTPHGRVTIRFQRTSTANHKITLGQATSLFTAVCCELFRWLNAVKVSTAAVNFEACESNTGVVLGVDALPDDSLSVVNKLQQASCLTDDHVTPC